MRLKWLKTNNNMEFGQEQLDELLNYIGYLEGQVDELKSTMIAVVQQRNAAMGKLKEITNRIHTPIVESRTVDTEFDLINPEQWGVPKGLVG